MRSLLNGLLLCAALAIGSAAEQDQSFPEAVSTGCGGDETCAAREEIATFAAGCFWSVELAFQRVPGVLSTQVGYAGGTVARPKYEDVYAGATQHAEVVRLVYDPEVVSFATLLDVFATKLPTSANHATVGSHLTFNQLVAKHNPADDHGTQYRSAVFYETGPQREAAVAWKRALEAKTGAKIVTSIEVAHNFWPAEEYHQRYLEKGGQSAEKGSEENIKCYG